MIDWIWDTDSDDDETSPYGFNEPTLTEGGEDEDGED